MCFIKYTHGSLQKREREREWEREIRLHVLLNKPIVHFKRERKGEREIRLHVLLNKPLVHFKREGGRERGRERLYYMFY